MLQIKLIISFIKAICKCFYSSTAGIFLFKETGRDLLYSFGLLRSVKIVEGVVKNEGKICVFASYQPSGINDLLLYYIKYLKEVMGFAIIFTINNNLNEKDIQKLKPYTYKIVMRANVGRDFGSYKYSIMRFREEITKAKLFLLANDSVYGPIQNLTPFLNKMEEGYDVVADVKNEAKEHSNHYGSYFILMNNTITSSNYFWNFWQQYKYISQRRLTVKKGEIEFSIKVLKNFRHTSFFNGNTPIVELRKLTPDEKNEAITSSIIKDFFDNTGNIKYFSLNPFPTLALNAKCFFIKRDWVKKFIIASTLIKKLEEVNFTTDIDKKLLINQLSSDAMIPKKIKKLIKQKII